MTFAWDVCATKVLPKKDDLAVDQALASASERGAGAAHRTASKRPSLSVKNSIAGSGFRSCFRQWFDQALADREERQLETVGNPELAEDLRQGMLDGFFAHG